VEVDLRSIRDNVAALRALVAPADICAVVKADGYSHGDAPVAEAALDAGATWLAVALVEEGVRLREAGLEAPILLLSEPALEDVKEVLHWRLTPTVYRKGTIAALGETAESPIGVHVKVDTGMHRVGAAPARVHELVEEIESHSRLRLAALWTHFAVSEEDGEFTAEQIDLFDRVTAPLRPPLVHLANTAGAVLYHEARRDLVRTGIGIYGIHPGPKTHGQIDLRPAMRIVSHVAFVQRLSSGDRPSYGRRRALAADDWVATVPIGYADGVPRLLSELGTVLIGGKRRPLAGTVTMDQIVVDLGREPVAVGEEVVLIGNQGAEQVTADEWAQLTGTIPYEIVSRIGPRLPRRYVL
jgi:alanine racemase